MVHCYLWTSNISSNQQRNEHHGSTQAGGDKSEEQNGSAVFRHFKLLVTTRPDGNGCLPFLRAFAVSKARPEPEGCRLCYS
jgi:hypothetical protein